MRLQMPPSGVAKENENVAVWFRSNEGTCRIVSAEVVIICGKGENTTFTLFEPIIAIRPALFDIFSSFISLGLRSLTTPASRAGVS
jgi:hypothetical protein